MGACACAIWGTQKGPVPAALGVKWLMAMGPSALGAAWWQEWLDLVAKDTCLEPQMKTEGLEQSESQNLVWALPRFPVAVSV